MLDVDKFCKLRPTLYHLAAEGSWPNIQRHGLLSTNEIYKRIKLDRHILQGIESHRRKKSRVVECREHGRFILRDRKPLSDVKLRTALDAWPFVQERLDVAQWIDLLNQRVFLFARKQNLDGLLSVNQNQELSHVILRINTRKLFNTCGPTIEVADINTGSTLHTPAPRGLGTFQSPEKYARTGARQIVEVTVLDSVPNIMPLLEQVVFRKACGKEELLYSA